MGLDDMCRAGSVHAHETTPAQVFELFEAAGFVRLDESVEITELPDYCTSAGQRQLQAFVATLAKPSQRK
jgi:hypothetical protein